MSSVDTFSAHAFHPSLKNGRSSGFLNISDMTVSFQADTKKVTFPLSEAHFKIGGASDRLVFVTHPAHPDWSIYTSDRSILQNERLRSDPGIASQLKTAGKVRVLNWSVLAVVLVLLVGGPLFLLFSMDSLTKPLAQQVPASWEAEMGKTVFGQYRVNQRLLETESSTEQLNLLVEPLISALDTDRYEFNIYIDNSSEINAFALPGGYVVINAGLILEAKNASEVLGVLAHEVAHVTEQHGLRNIMGTAGIYLIIQGVLGDVSGLLATVADAAPLLLNQSYSRSFETEADEKGLQLLRKANIDPQGLVTFFETIMAKEKEKMGTMVEDEDTREMVGDALSFLSTHPATDERIENIKRQIKPNEQGYKDLDVAFQALKREVEAFVAKGNSE